MIRNIYLIGRNYCLILIFSIFINTNLLAANFTITAGDTNNNSQSLEGNEVGVIEAGGTLDVTADDSLSAIDFTGTDNLFTNDGNFTYNKTNMNGDNNIFTNNGQMTSDGSNNSNTIFNITGDNNKFVNNGDIYHSKGVKPNIDDFAFLGGNNNEFINNGTITKENTAWDVLWVDGETASNFVNNGEIYIINNITNNWNSFLYLSDYKIGNSSNNIFTNNNIIEVTNTMDYVVAIWNDFSTNSQNNVFNNNGIISSYSANRYSQIFELYYYDDSATNNIINNYGTFLASTYDSSSTAESYAIYIDKTPSGNKTNNYGNIIAETPLSEAIGIYSYNLYTNISHTPYSYEVYNEGTITANSENGEAYGIKGDILADNYGTITANSITNNAYGVWHESISNSSPQITNRLNGVISASSTDADAYAIHNESSELAYQIDNYGTIIANSKNGNAYAISGNAIINNYGIITANSENGAEYVFYSPDNNNTISSANQVTTFANHSGHVQIINLFPGSQIIGKMNLSSNDVINLYLEPDTTMNIIIEGSPEINIANNNSNIIITEHGIMSIDTNIEDLLRKNLLDSNQQITDIIKENIIYQKVNKHKNHNLWANLIKYDLEHEKYDNIAAYKNKAYGLVAGVDFEQKNLAKASFVAVLDKNSESDKHSLPFKLDAQQVALGSYFNFSLGNFTLTNALTVAYQFNETERNIIDNIYGTEVAIAKFNSMQLTPQLNLAYSHDFYNFTFIPNLNLTYSKEFYESYNETGTTNANRNFSKRDIDYYSLDLALSVNKKILDNKADLQFTLGRKNHYFNQENATIAVANNTNHQITIPKHNLSNNYFTTAFNYQINKDLDLKLGIKPPTKINAKAKLSFRF